MTLRMRGFRQYLAMLVVVVGLVGPLISSVAAQTPDDPAADVLPWFWSLGSYRETATIVVGDDLLTVEIADDGALRSRGLSYRDGLEPGTGMLFIYPDEGMRSFWMRAMRFCLDIVWLSDDDVIGFAEDVCPEPGVREADLQRYISPEPVRFVLEVPGGWMAERGYGPGTPIDLSDAID